MVLELQQLLQPSPWQSDVLSALSPFRNHNTNSFDFHSTSPLILQAVFVRTGDLVYLSTSKEV
jgi:hypothetical protein